MPDQGYLVYRFPQLCELLFGNLVEIRGIERSAVVDALAADILTIKGRVLPKAVQKHVTHLPEERRSLGDSLTRRQSRHRKE